jgi:uncharacterized cupredoxin-like copper-binding protein
MTAYYVLGIAFVVFALVLTAFGLTRENFPPTVRGGRLLIGIAGFIALATFAVLLVSTEVEHPREEAKAKELESAAGAQEPGGEAGGHEAGAEQAQGGTVAVLEDEYSIELPQGRTLEAGPYAFEAANKGEIDHDLAVRGPAVGTKKTPLIKPGDIETLEAQLVPGRYKLWCTVPGHESAGMRTAVTVE